MSENEKEILKKVADALPRMSEFDKGYLVGLADGHRQQEEKEEKED